MARSVQLQVRVTPEERAEYDRLRSRGLTADRALLEVLGSRYPLKIQVAPARVETDTFTASRPFRGPENQSGVRPRPGPRVLPKGFKPDFKGKGKK